MGVEKVLTITDSFGYAKGANKNFPTGGCRSGLYDNQSDICQSILSVYDSEVNNARRCPTSGNGWDSPTVSGLFVAPAGFFYKELPVGISTHGGTSMCKNLIASNNTILLEVQERVGDVQASLKYLVDSTSCESGALGQISCLLNVLSLSLRSAYSDLAEYTFNNNINYDNANQEVAQ